MFCLNCYLWEYVNKCLSGIDLQLSAYIDLHVAKGEGRQGRACLPHHAVGPFRWFFFDRVAQILRHHFCHSRSAKKRNDDPLKEDPVIRQSMNHHGDQLREHAVKPDPDKSVARSVDKSVLKFRAGEEIKLSEEDFLKIYKAFFPENERNLRNEYWN